MASDRHSPGPPGLIFGQKHLMGVCIAVSADLRGSLLGYCVTRSQDEEDERKHFKCVAVRACCLHSVCVEARLSLFSLELALLYDQRATLSSSDVFQTCVRHETRLRQSDLQLLETRFLVCVETENYRLFVPFVRRARDRLRFSLYTLLALTIGMK